MTATPARCLRMLEQARAVGTAARTSVLAALTAAQLSRDGCSRRGRRSTDPHRHDPAA